MGRAEISTASVSGVHFLLIEAVIETTSQNQLIEAVIETTSQNQFTKVGLPQLTGVSGDTNRSDRPEQPIRPAEPSTEQTIESAATVSVPSVDEASVVPPIAEDEELVDYKVSPERRSMWCTYLRITSWFRKRIWLIFSSGPMKLCSRSRARRTITSRLFT